MTFQVPTRKTYSQKIISWSSVGLLVFISSFLWGPTRDGVQAVYVLSFFLPMLLLLCSRKPDFCEYGGWMTASALIYAGFSVLSSLWGHPKDFGFFVLQWFALAVWLCGSCLIFSKRDIDLSKYLPWLILLGSIITITVIIRYYVFEYAMTTFDKRLWGWNVFKNPNEIGAMCGITALLAFICALQSESSKRIYFFYGCMLIAVIGLVLSLSRGALLALVITSIAAVVIIRPPLRNWLPPVVAIAIMFLVALSTTSLHIYYTGGRGEGFGGRFAIWQVVFESFRENILFGVGMSKETGINVPNIAVFNHAHNAWLDTLYRTGLIGFTLVMLHLALILKKITKGERFLPLYLWLCYGCICSLLDGRCFFWEIGAKWFLYWIPAGLIAATHTGIHIRMRKGNPNDE